MSDALGSTISGAASGFAAGGPLGAIIGGVAGLFSGLSSDKARKYKRLANKEEDAAIEIKRAAQRRDVLRSFYIARAQAVAAAGSQESGGLQSSAAQGAISSVGSQGIANLKFFDALTARSVLEKYYLRKAGKKIEQANTIDSIGEALSGIDYSKFGGGVKTKDATQAGNGGYSPSDGGYPS